VVIAVLDPEPFRGQERSTLIGLDPNWQRLTGRIRPMVHDVSFGPYALDDNSLTQRWSPNILAVAGSTDIAASAGTAE